MIQNRELTMDDYLGMLRRRIWVILVPALIAPAIGFGISYLLAAKYNPNGGLIWKRLYDAPGPFDTGKFMGIDALGYIYVAGNLTGANGRDYVLWRLNSDGSPGWPESCGACCFTRGSATTRPTCRR